MGSVQDFILLFLCWCVSRELGGMGSYCEADQGGLQVHGICGCSLVYKEFVEALSNYKKS